MPIQETFYYLPADVAAMDRRAIEQHGVDGYGLMCRAGGRAYDLLRRCWPATRRLWIVCGAGNNAGDGYVIGRLALADGLQVRLTALAPPEKLRGDARKAAEDYLGAGGEVDASLESGVACDVVIDALLGTGLDRMVEGNFAEAVAAINNIDAPVLAMDIPSGLHGGTGRVMGCAVRADRTISFIGRKLGLYTGAGPAFAGEVYIDHLDVPQAVFDAATPVARGIGASHVAAWLPRRLRDAHKGDFGHVLVVGGNRGMPGAARMAAESAARVGAGLVSVATHPDHAAVLNIGRPELMVHGVVSAAQLAPLLVKATCVVLGPGLGTDDWAQSLWETALVADLPTVVDADGLNLLAGSGRHGERWVLTPHPGEAGRLLDMTTAEVQSDRLATWRRLLDRFGGAAVLKGAGSLAGADSVCPWLCTAGNPGMASGGMGDVLSGVIGGLLAQGVSLDQAAAAGVWLHATAADVAAVGSGERGLLAGDLMPHLRKLVNP